MSVENKKASDKSSNLSDSRIVLAEGCISFSNKRQSFDHPHQTTAHDEVRSLVGRSTASVNGGEPYSGFYLSLSGLFMPLAA